MSKIMLLIVLAMALSQAQANQEPELVAKCTVSNNAGREFKVYEFFGPLFSEDAFVKLTTKFYGWAEWETVERIPASFTFGSWVTYKVTYTTNDQDVRVEFSNHLYKSVGTLSVNKVKQADLSCELTDPYCESCLRKPTWDCLRVCPREAVQ